MVFFIKWTERKNVTIILFIFYDVKNEKKNETLFLFAHFNKPVFTVYYETPIF